MNASTLKRAITISSHLTSSHLIFFNMQRPPGTAAGSLLPFSHSFTPSFLIHHTLRFLALTPSHDCHQYVLFPKPNAPTCMLMRLATAY